jgi:hypothetical protein
MKKFLIPLLFAAIALVSAAFTRPTNTPGKSIDPPETGYFSFGGEDNEQDDASKYTYIGEVAPMTDCSESEVLCTISAGVDVQSHPENSAVWKPDFSEYNPVDDPSEFDYKRYRDD